MDLDVKNRIKQGWMKLQQVSGITCHPRMSPKLKAEVYITIRSFVVHGFECKTTKEDYMRQQYECYGSAK